MTTEWEYYGKPEPFEFLAATSKFFQVAATAHERFGALPAYDRAIQIIPLERGGKRPASGFLPSKHMVPKTPEALALLASAYPDANVGINSCRAVGALLVIDCDEQGVDARIERETGRKLPLTYTTLTRPKSKRHKRHIYFQSTEYSVSQIRKQVTDVTRICGYDLKGCGTGYGYVASEGCIRDGEDIVALHDVPIQPIPDWLVDFLVADVAKGRATKRTQSTRSEKTKPHRQKQEPSSCAVALGDRNWTIASRIRTLKNLGFSDDAIHSELVRIIRTCFESGDQLLTAAYMRKLRDKIRKVPTVGIEVSLHNLLRHRRSHRSTMTLTTIRERFESCPQDISAADARAFFFVRTRADHERMRREFHRHGYIYVGSQGSHKGVWSHRFSHPSTPLKKSSTSLSIDFSPSLYRFSEGAGSGPAPHRKVCMSTQTAMDQQFAPEPFIHTRYGENTGKMPATMGATGA